MRPFGLVDRIRVTIGRIIGKIGDAQARRLGAILTLARKRQVPAFICEAGERGKPHHSAFT
jgi:hypothetical protein